ncbi:hypothetical protein A3860_07390 [Niastella vici]|uniref:Uncharacterized protein n=1 Tax=Niastella vici TaxID=1703345 RepID=A0A1V9FIH6_9BACT|nr:hypothetical protein A3860_07390 [Niastella vici]
MNTMERSRMHFAEMPGMSRIFLRFHSRCECIQSWLNNKHVFVKNMQRGFCTTGMCLQLPGKKRQG